MTGESKIFDEVRKVAGEAAETFSTVRSGVESQLRHGLESLLARTNLVTREEFEAVMALAARAREEQEKLGVRVAALEEALKAAAPSLAPKKAAAAKAPTPARKAPADSTPDSVDEAPAKAPAAPRRKRQSPAKGA